MLTNVNTCPLCGDAETELFLERHHVPLHQNLLCRSPLEARALNCGELAICLCSQCGFVFNAAFRPDLMSYGQSYDNVQDHSPLFRHYLEELAGDLMSRYHLYDKNIVEVGCGKGDFLRLLCNDGKNRGLGFDPSYIGPETIEGGAVRIVREFYDGQHSGQSPDFVCCRHVIEHIAAPLEMLRGIRKTLGESCDAVLYFETPDVEWILEQTVFWDFFYEHCSYFTPKTLAWAFEMAGFRVINVRKVFGGQYLALEARARTPDPLAAFVPTDAAEGLKKSVSAFCRRMGAKVAECRELVLRFTHEGGCALWGAAAKGVTFANVIDPDMAHIKCVVDINPAKAGCYVPGSGHPIVGLGELGKLYQVAGVLSMNPNYLSEQRAMLAELSLSLPVEALR